MGDLLCSRCGRRHYECSCALPRTNTNEEIKQATCRHVHTVSPPNLVTCNWCSKRWASEGREDVAIALYLETHWQKVLEVRNKQGWDDKDVVCDPAILTVVRDLFLMGNDIDAIAVLAEEVGMSQWDTEAVVDKLFTRNVHTSNPRTLRPRVGG